MRTSWLARWTVSAGWKVALRCTKQRGWQRKTRLHRPSAAQKQQQIAELEEGAEKGATLESAAMQGGWRRGGWRRGRWRRANANQAIEGGWRRRGRGGGEGGFQAVRGRAVGSGGCEGGDGEGGEGLRVEARGGGASVADVSVTKARAAEAKGLAEVEVMLALAERGGDRGGGGRRGGERGSGERSVGDAGEGVGCGRDGSRGAAEAAAAKALASQRRYMSPGWPVEARPVSSGVVQ